MSNEFCSSVDILSEGIFSQHFTGLNRSIRQSGRVLSCSCVVDKLQTIGDKSMFKRNKFYTVVAASALISISAMSTAQVTTPSTATVTVANAVALQEDVSLSFGQLAVFQSLDVSNDGSPINRVDQPVYTVSSNPLVASGVTAAASDATDTVSRIVEVSPGTPAEFSITNAARFTNLSVDLSGATSFSVADPLIDGNLNSTFTAAIAEANITIVGGPFDGQTLDDDGSGSPTAPLRTDASGNVGMRVGATITPNVAAAAILEGNYVGSYTITVSY